MCLKRNNPQTQVDFSLECVSKREIRKFEWIFRQFKEEIRRLSSAKSRIDDAEMAERRPKLRIKEFLRHTLAALACFDGSCLNIVGIAKAAYSA